MSSAKTTTVAAVIVRPTPAAAIEQGDADRADRLEALHEHLPRVVWRLPWVTVTVTVTVRVGVGVGVRFG